MEDQESQTALAPYYSINSSHCKKAIRLQQYLIRRKTMYASHQKESSRKLSFAGSELNQFVVQPLGHNIYSELYFKEGTLHREHHVFAFVWFHVRAAKRREARVSVSGRPPELKYEGAAVSIGASYKKTKGRGLLRGVDKAEPLLSFLIYFVFHHSRP